MASARSVARTTPAIVVCFPNVFEMRSYQGGTPSYSVRLMFDKKNKEHMDFLRTIAKDAQQVLEAQWPDPATRPRIPIVGDDDSSIKDGDKNCNRQRIPFKEKYPELEGHFFFNASKYKEPLYVVDRGRNENLTKKDIYSGCICKVSINAYARVRSDNPGISWGLNGVQKWADGEHIGSGGGPRVEDMFSADTGADDPANYISGGLFGEAPTQAEVLQTHESAPFVRGSHSDDPFG